MTRGLQECATQRAAVAPLLTSPKVPALNPARQQKGIKGKRLEIILVN